MFKLTITYEGKTSTKTFQTSLSAAEYIADKIGCAANVWNRGCAALDSMINDDCGKLICGHDAAYLLRHAAPVEFTFTEATKSHVVGRLSRL